MFFIWFYIAISRSFQFSLQCYNCYLIFVFIRYNSIIIFHFSLFGNFEIFSIFGAHPVPTVYPIPSHQAKVFIFVQFQHFVNIWCSSLRAKAFISWIENDPCIGDVLLFHLPAGSSWKYFYWIGFAGSSAQFCKNKIVHL